MIGDVNCFYRALSLYFTNNEVNYTFIREIIYNTANENKEFIKPFFLKGINDVVLA